MCAVVPRALAWLSHHAVVPLAICGSTVSDFCIDCFPAEVGTDVILFTRVLPRTVQSCLAVVSQGGAVVPCPRQYLPQPLCYRSALVADVAVVPRVLTVVPRGLAVVPLVSKRKYRVALQ